MQDKNEKPKRFDEWFDNYDYPIDIRNPILKLPKKERLYFLREVAIQSWKQQESEIERLRKENKKLLVYKDIKETNDKIESFMTDIKRVSKLEKCLEISRSANRFYGDKGSWIGDIFTGEDDTELFFMPNCTSRKVNGKRAREAEKQINEILKGEK